ncbi:ribosome biogenesis regulatory protein homolog [Argiope bruennichi]|uniref:Ribosome biogenesis regulatory protein n=1 Tax=Argiope bruennichi TaxID=94029 RepID=A0A8T0G0T8_ARGBR|nr:ribosome biogenesis regulatory protein homolog [Argiope bruennichi]KAF8796964.1 Ribosome biogenesis regulatory protein like protein [Argiope bruennichi]
MADHEDLNEVYTELDVGNLCVTNVTLLRSSLEKNYSEENLKRLAVQGTQKLLNEIFKLPSQYHEHVPVAKLPEPTSIIPREKPIPKPKTMTKWEKFAKAKGIKKQKKEKLVFDESNKEWKPRYGYRGIKNKEDWVKEIPDNADPNEDYFGKAKEQKKERIAKNDYHRLRNIASATKMKVTNLESVDLADKHQLSRSLTSAKSATASLGRFADKLPNERAPKNKMQKRKFKPNNPSNLREEKENNLKILENLEKKMPKLNVQEAVQRYMAKPLKEGKTDEQVQSREKKYKSKKNKFMKNKLYRAGKKKGPRNAA